MENSNLGSPRMTPSGPSSWSFCRCAWKTACCDSRCSPPATSPRWLVGSGARDRSPRRARLAVEALLEVRATRALARHGLPATRTRAGWLHVGVHRFLRFLYPPQKRFREVVTGSLNLSSQAKQNASRQVAKAQRKRRNASMSNGGERATRPFSAATCRRASAGRSRQPEGGSQAHPERRAGRAFRPPPIGGFRRTPGR